MRILWLATKLPWPPVDGGRLVARLTIEALAARGHHVTLLAPASEPFAIELSKKELGKLGARLETFRAKPRPRWLDALAIPLSRRPWTVRRHASKELRRRARELARQERFDLVHAEQVQTVPAALDAGLPFVLRAQNVESDLWLSLARRRPLLGRLVRVEAGRLAAYEAEAVRRSSRTVALTEEDAARLRQLAGADEQGAGREKHGEKVVALEAPFPGELPPGSVRLDGDPPLVLFGSPGWWPNRDGARFLLEEVWPLLRERHPRAVLHVFGFDGSPRSAPGERLRHHAPPAESADALPPGSILLVPLFVSSGVRMKILEAWARGVPVIASPAAARGLAASSGRELMVAEGPTSWADAVESVVARGESFIESGRAALAKHAPARIARELERVYRRALDS